MSDFIIQTEKRRDSKVNTRYKNASASACGIVPLLSKTIVLISFSSNVRINKTFVRVKKQVEVYVKVIIMVSVRLLFVVKV